MAITLNISNEAEKILREAWGGELDRAALEALAIEGYRSRKIGLGTVRRILGLANRWETEAWLGQRGVPWNYTLEDLQADSQALDQTLGPVER